MQWHRNGAKLAPFLFNNDITLVLYAHNRICLWRHTTLALYDAERINDPRGHFITQSVIVNAVALCERSRSRYFMRFAVDWRPHPTHCATCAIATHHITKHTSPHKPLEGPCKPPLGVSIANRPQTRLRAPSRTL